MTLLELIEQWAAENNHASMIMAPSEIWVGPCVIVIGRDDVVVWSDVTMPPISKLHPADPQFFEKLERVMQ